MRRRRQRQPQAIVRAEAVRTRDQVRRVQLNFIEPIEIAHEGAGRETDRNDSEYRRRHLWGSWISGRKLLTTRARQPHQQDRKGNRRHVKEALGHNGAGQNDQVRRRSHRGKEQPDAEEHDPAAAITEDADRRQRQARNQRDHHLPIFRAAQTPAEKRNLVVRIVAGKFRGPDQEPKILAQHLDRGQPRRPEIRAVERIVGIRNHDGRQFPQYREPHRQIDQAAQANGHIARQPVAPTASRARGGLRERQIPEHNRGQYHDGALLGKHSDAGDQGGAGEPCQPLLAGRPRAPDVAQQSAQHAQSRQDIRAPHNVSDRFGKQGMDCPQRRGGCGP